MNLPPVCQKEGRASGEQRPDLCPLSSGQYVPLLGQLIPRVERANLPLSSFSTLWFCLRRELAPFSYGRHKTSLAPDA